MIQRRRSTSVRIFDVDRIASNHDATMDMQRKRGKVVNFDVEELFKSELITIRENCPLQNQTVDRSERHGLEELRQSSSSRLPGTSATVQ
eukprot:scaffold16612_cov35-Attheya_sp.AAC.5